MKLLLIIALVIASLSFTGVVKAADFCASHNQRVETTSQDSAPNKAPELPCSDCCVDHCGHMMFFSKVQTEQPPLVLAKYIRKDATPLQGREPLGLFRPPQAA